MARSRKTARRSRWSYREMTREGVLRDWAFLLAERDGDADAIATIENIADEGEVSVESWIQNEAENAVDRAVKLGLIEWDGENNGWHEGWNRMVRALDAMAYEFMKANSEA